MATSRELVFQTLQFQHPERVTRHLWTLPWAEYHYPDELKKIVHDFPSDITSAPSTWSPSPLESGDQYAVGDYVDPWGCRFINIQQGVIGEVKHPLVTDPDYADLGNVRVPVELLEVDVERVNQFCRQSTQFVMSPATVNLFERMQYIRKSDQLYMDLATRPGGLYRLIDLVHDFNCRRLEAWAQTDVDGLAVFDDWGAQNRLLISPKMWVELFKPRYKEYIDIAHAHGKKIFFHTDGYSLAILPHFIEMGLDAVNTQLFCMGLDALRIFRGSITFWGEIDRQYLLSRGTPAEVARAVEDVKAALWKDGGCIAQCEFGAGARAENVYTVFQTWDQIGAE